MSAADSNPPQDPAANAVGSDALVRLRWDHPVYYPVWCPQCGWKGMSNETAGGNQIADTGDYNECVCPKCIAPDGDYEEGEWVPVADIPEPNETSAATGSERNENE